MSDLNNTIIGKSLSSGIGIGRIIILKNSERTIDAHKVDDANVELKKFNDAMQEVSTETNKIVDEAKDDTKEIMSAYLMILEDPTLSDETKNLISNENYNAPYAVESGFNNVITMFENIGDEYLAGRARDIADIKNRVIAKLLGERMFDLGNLPKSSIIVAHELTTSDTAKLNFENISGIITEIGGETSHTAIMARSHDIPCVSGVENAVEIFSSFDQDTECIVDAKLGKVILNPDSETLANYGKSKSLAEASKNELEGYRGKESKTIDGHDVLLVANIGNPDDAKKAFENDAEGSGLFRSEFLFMDAENMPSEDEQYNAYVTASKNLQNKKIIIRTLDVGGDKNLKYLSLPKEANPFLGERAIRLCLNNIDLFKTQLRAILRASATCDLAIMFPMISSIEELRKAKFIVEECKKELIEKGEKYNENIEVGIMVEIPAAAVNADNFAKECDFFSIGTNDLIQYTTAVERGNERIAHLYTKFNPAVIKLVKMAIDGAHKYNIMCGMCGEAAGDAKYIPLLLGLGLDEFSMSSNKILAARKTISNLSYEKCKNLANEIVNLSTAEDVEKALDEFIK